MFKWLNGKVAALTATTMAFVSTASFAQDPSPVDALTTAQAAIEADISTAAGVMVSLAVAVIAGFFIYGVIRKRG